MSDHTADRYGEETREQKVVQGWIELAREIQRGTKPGTDAHDCAVTLARLLARDALSVIASQEDRQTGLRSADAREVESLVRELAEARAALRAIEGAR